MKKSLKFFGALGAMLAISGTALADSVTGTAIADTAFQQFAATILAWLKGGLAIGISLIALLVGAAIGISNGSALPMIVGLVMAAGFAFLPAVLSDLVLGAEAALLPMSALVGG